MGDFSTNAIQRYDISSSLTWSVSALPISGGLAWIAEDLDKDGEFELLVQRSDALADEGYLDIHRSSDWSLRQRFVFPEKRGWMYPEAGNFDADSDIEVFATLNDGAGGSAMAALIDYDPAADSFVLRSTVSIPVGFGGRPAAEDFDKDGNYEFVCGGLDGYGLVELTAGGLHYIGSIDPTVSNNNAAAAGRMFSPQKSELLLSHAYDVWWIDIWEAIGDNTFQLVQTVAESTGATGFSNCVVSDSDCDSLDEFVGKFFPHWIEWGWNQDQAQFDSACAWNYPNFPSPFAEWYTIDLDRDGRNEWCAITNDYTFYVFPDPACFQCDSLGKCPLKLTGCFCPCAGDPECDQVRVDIRDVVTSISVAFRGEPSLVDESCPKSRTDVDCDGVTSVIDVVKTVGVAFRGEDIMTTFCPPCP